MDGAKVKSWTGSGVIVDGRILHESAECQMIDRKLVGFPYTGEM